MGRRVRRPPRDSGEAMHDALDCSDFMTGERGRRQANGRRAPFERLRAGEIDLETYLDLKIDLATAHLRGLSEDQLRTIRATLRERLACDPALVELVELVRVASLRS
jgi:hypothetical protein